MRKKRDRKCARGRHARPLIAIEEERGLPQFEGDAGMQQRSMRGRGNWKYEGWSQDLAVS
jgi:hypothetical protein